MFDERVEASPLEIAQLGKNEKGVFIPVTYIQLQERVRALAASLKELGLRRGDKVTLFSDNRPEWLTLDLAILSLGAADVPRGRDAMEYELLHMLTVTEAEIIIVENKELLNKYNSIKSELKGKKKVIIIDEKDVDDESVLSYSDLLNHGHVLLEKKEVRDDIIHQIALGGENDIATIIFTSGTTGMPKGVMTTHRNFLYQTECLDKCAPFKKGEIWLSVLPVWHSFERILQYLILFETDTVAYSKPIGKIMLTDLARINPHYLGSVPRIWETVKAGVYQNLKNMPSTKRKLFNFFLKASIRYSDYRLNVIGATSHIKGGNRTLERVLSFFPYLIYKPFNAFASKFVFSEIKKKLGTNFKAGISGGGSMSRDVDEFFRAIGIKLMDGYGMTETSPVIGLSDYYNPKKRFIHPLDERTEIKVVSTETGKELKQGEKGELIVRGPQVMAGYYKDSERTGAMIDKDGFIHTGDLAVISREGDFILVGRAKDTIVLSGGENIEPIPIEQALRSSEYIENCVVVGQDRKSLGVLITLDKKNVERYLKSEAIPYINREDLEELEEVNKLINSVITSLISKANGFKAYEQISRFRILSESFQNGIELSAKGEVKRKVISEKYKEDIDSLYA